MLYVILDIIAIEIIKSKQDLKMKTDSEKMKKHDVLFICEGNVGRSQIAEGFYNHFRRNKTAISAGIKDLADKYGGKPTKRLIKVMLEEGIDISSHKIKQVTEDMVLEAKHIVILCDREICPKFLLTGDTKIIFKKIKDPYQEGARTTRYIRDSIKEFVLRLNF